MSTALGGVLTVDKRIVFLAILVGVGYNHLDVGACEMHYRVKWVVGHILAQQVDQTVARMYAPTVVYDCETGVEKRVVFHHRLHKLIVVFVVQEYVLVGNKLDIRAVFLVGWADWAVVGDFSTAVAHFLFLAVAA